MIKDKALINGFSALQVADFAITDVGTKLYNMTEANPLGYDERALIIKFCVTVLLVGMYALSKESNHKYWRSIETSIQIGLIITLIFIASNTVQVGIELAR